ncbi:hypothetical protein I302_108189 [Kwoniella bestiolae CBS 10118]|uniref:Uncharacterized protein n=1 Tax=Kwoniella bestiolae CBS 10118 TaxID=1296100 RepID=A0A1B9FWE8_9TREE|nr:hypothetical protein I302_07445 [Kwoniella bestiolae CBS 10118]OCF23094.1 hypothetical protein I302_07445 [Kwoniella bestiolae CBS 10118]
MGILLSLLRPSHQTHPTSKPSISHPYPLGSQHAADPASPRMAPTRSRSVRSIRDTALPQNVRRRLSHREGEEGEEGLRSLLSPSPNDLPSSGDSVASPTSTYRSDKRRLRKVLKVDNGWDLVREVDLDGYGYGYSHEDGRGG